MSNVKNYHKQGGETWVVEGELEIAASGKLIIQGEEIKPATAQTDSEATSVDGLKDDLNSLLEKLRAAGLMKSG